MYSKDRKEWNIKQGGRKKRRGQENKGSSCAPPLHSTVRKIDKWVLVPALLLLEMVGVVRWNVRM
jgi:hypothetical protein